MALRRLLKKPKLEDGSLLSVFYYCDMSVNHHMKSLNHLMRNNPDNLDHRAMLIRQLKEAQHNTMNVIMSIAEQAIPDSRASRDFRSKYPDDVLLDQINGPIWFGAECIAAGSHIANHELESTELRPFALHLSKVVTKVRLALRVQSFVNKEAYPQKIKEMLIEFDKLWADFEFRYISLMCDVKTEVQYYHQQDVVVLFCESTLRAIRKKYLSYDIIEMMDPCAMFAIPRLAILCGLTVFPDGPINPSKLGKDMPQCFRAYRQLLLRIEELLRYLNSEQLDVLEQALCSSEGLGTLERNKLKASASRKMAKAQQSKVENETGSVANSRSSVQHGASVVLVNSATPCTTPSRSPRNSTSLPEEHQRGQSQDFVSQGSSRRDVFEPRPVDETDLEESAVTLCSTGEGGPQGEGVMVLEDVEPFPHFGANRPIDNELPSSSSSPSSGGQQLPSLVQSTSQQHRSPSSSTPSLSPFSPSLSSASNRPTTTSVKAKGPAGFPTAEDLMHRLFLGISGVADQLQTNHAKDLRVILKTVFSVCQSDPLTSDDVIQSVADHSRGKCPGVEPCSSEPHSPLINASDRFNFHVERTNIEETPSWTPDSDFPMCSMCAEKFSWKRRRHHCRGCGKVVCARCSPNNIPLFRFGIRKPVRVCSDCYIVQLSHILHAVTGSTGISSAQLQAQY